MPLRYSASAVRDTITLLILLSIPVAAMAQTTSEDRFIGILATGNQTQFTRLVTSTFDQPGVLTEVRDFGENPIRGCEVLDDGASNEIFCVNFDGSFNRINIETGAITLVDTLEAQEGEGWEGLAYDESTQTLYGIATVCSGSGATSLYTIDPITATATFVGADNKLTCGVAVAADASGQLFAIGVRNDALVQINSTDGSQTLVGTLDYAANFSQGMDIDPSDGTCYLFAFNDGEGIDRSELRTCNLTDATTTLVGVLGEQEPGGRFTLSTGVVVPKLSVSNEDDAVAAKAFELHAVYPNPVRDVAKVELAAARPGVVRVVLYDVLGRAVQTVFEGSVGADQSVTVPLLAGDLKPGVYMLRAYGAGTTTTRRVTIVR